MSSVTQPLPRPMGLSGFLSLMGNCSAVNSLMMGVAYCTKCGNLTTACTAFARFSSIRFLLPQGQGTDMSSADQLTWGRAHPFQKVLSVLPHLLSLPQALIKSHLYSSNGCPEVHSTNYYVERGLDLLVLTCSFVVSTLGILSAFGVVTVGAPTFISLTFTSALCEVFLYYVRESKEGDQRPTLPEGAESRGDASLCFLHGQPSIHAAYKTFGDSKATKAILVVSDNLASVVSERVTPPALFALIHENAAKAKEAKKVNALFSLAGASTGLFSSIKKIPQTRTCADAVKNVGSLLSSALVVCMLFALSIALFPAIPSALPKMVGLVSEVIFVLTVLFSPVLVYETGKEVCSLFNSNADKVKTTSSIVKNAANLTRMANKCLKGNKVVPFAARAAKQTLPFLLIFGALLDLYLLYMKKHEEASLYLLRHTSEHHAIQNTMV